MATANYTPPLPRRRRFRLTIRTAMLAIPVLALILISATGIDPFRSDPYSIAIANQTEWCRSNVGRFQADGQFDWSRPEPSFVVDKPESSSVACLVKIGFVHRPRFNGTGLGCDVDSNALAVDGRSSMTRDIYSWAVQGGQSTISSGDLLESRKLVATLPSSHWWIPEGNTVVVGFLRKNVWSTRNYDKDQLPPEVIALMAKLGMSLP